jgi:hypothetical protein
LTTCPRCGRVAGDEVVCAGCGLSLALTRRKGSADSAALIEALGAAEEHSPISRDVKIWRVALLVCVTCLIAGVAALVLLHQHGSDKAGRELPLPTAPATSPEVSALATPAASSVTRSGHPSTTTTTKPEVGHSPTTAAPSKTASTAPRSLQRTTSSTPAVRSVHVSRGSLDPKCGPHCHRLNVTLSAFPSGTHRVACWSARGGLFSSYATTAVTSADCTDKRPHDSVWVSVDARYRSNTVTW